MTDLMDAQGAADFGPDGAARPQPLSLAIDAVVASKVSFATQQNDVPVLKELRLANLQALPVERLVLEIEADPPVFAPRTWRFDRIAGEGEVAVRDRDLQLNAAYLQQLSEAVRATVTLRARQEAPDAPALAERRFPVEVLARGEWGGAGAQPELLAAFVLPNDGATSRILKAASRVLASAGRPDGIDGYQAKSRERVYELASALWSAVVGLKLTYAEPPASFELQGQKVRTPSAALEAGLATCLDTALLFAAALEQAGLYPVIVLTKGHAFTGVWLQPQEFATLLVEDAAALRKRLALNELILFETTLATGSAPAGFARAIEQGERQVAEAREAEFVMAVDVRRARLQRLRPLALAEVASPVAPEIAPEAPGAADRLEEAPALGGFDLAEPEAAPTTPEGRLERWRRKLLDLTTRNRLLNVTLGPNALRLLCPEPAALEDRLAAGDSFRVVALPQFEGAAGRDGELHTQRTGEVLDVAYARSALEAGEVLSPLSPEKLDAQLTDLYRKARSDLAEGGANTLFLAVGFLCWKKSPADEKSYRAPLILLPVQLERRSVRSGVRLKAYEEEPRFNLTLLQMLRQDFDLDIPELAGALPTDESGVDVPRIWALVRRAVRDAPGFEVVEDVVLGAFSFAKYLMWKDLSDRSEALKRNPVVRHLLETPRERYSCDQEPPRPEQLDAQVSPGELFAPLPADSSQLAAVIGSARGCDFVLDGPPGTGKSQTIANMIAHNLALGRKVLFVAEKRAALEVVHRRLVQHGLGPFCLELHSNKAAKVDVLAQLDAAWTIRGELDAGQWDRRAAELKTSRDGLNRLVQALHVVHPNGLTLYQAIGRVVRDGADATVRLAWPDDRRHDAAQMEALREAARQLDIHRLTDLGEAEQDFARVGRAEWSPRWQSELLASSAALAKASAAAAAARTRFVERLGAEVSGDSHGLHALAALSQALDAAAGLDLGFAFEPDAARTIAQARKAIVLVRSYREEASTLSTALDPAAVRAVAVDDLARDWAAAVSALWPLSLMRKAAVAKRLNPAAKADVEADLPRLRRLQDTLSHIDALAGQLSGTRAWAGLDTDVDALERSLQAAEMLRTALAGAADIPEQLTGLRASLRRLCAEGSDLLGLDGAVGRAGAAWREAYAAFQAALDAFEAVAAPPEPVDAPDLLAAATALAAALQLHAPKLNAWCAWLRARAGAMALGLVPLVAAVEADALEAGRVADAFELAYARWWAEITAEVEPAVRDFNLAAQTDAIARFRDLDARLAELTQLYIRARLSGRVPSKEAKGRSPGLQALAYQIAHPKSRKRLRELVAEMGPELTTLAPCMLMSPLSVAQYLPADLALFDLVIFDEASQITPWDAVGAIARGKQLVVAGDPKQMPPTSFFDRGSSGPDDDSDVEADQESILDECLSASLPQRRLTWHYRSRNESLIAFSNHRYYDGDLVTFPAPVVTDAAVSLRQVEGAWARGKARTNQVEAHAIVSEVVRRLADPAFVDEAGRRLSLAVITLNAEQQKLVEDLLDKARRADPRLEAAFAEDMAEPVVVKNLETVQGDERDVILLGIGYGPETPGTPTMTMNFGPLNRQGGWRRLNVAITRARREMVVFTSFSPSLIDLNRTNAVAVRDLKHFLEFAERGPRALGEAVEGSVGGFESPFEQAVARALQERGWRVIPQIGVSRFRIDLGVVHPDRPGDYLVGVECDGASYHSAATARDRDKVREAVLKGLGWSLVRVWSTDWWIDRQGALDRLTAALEAELTASRARFETQAKAVPLEPPADISFAVSELEAVVAVHEPEAAWEAAPGGDYRLTSFDDMAGRLDASRFQDTAYAPVLREMVARVVSQEAPIRDDVLVERIARAHGIKRNGRLIRERVLSFARGSAHVQPEPQGGAVFVWPDATAPATWSRARYPASPNDCRPLEDIALAELGAALRDCLSEDPILEAARSFGIRRVSAAARDRLARARPSSGHLAP